MTDQEKAFEKLSRLKVGALFMDMGTGKTKVALDLMASRLKKDVNYFLWICPFSVKADIEAERKKWHPELNLDIVGAETISSSGRIYLDKMVAVKTHKSFIVVDESLKIKNIEALRTQRILELGKLAKYRLILNGTPISSNLLDLYPQMQFLSPKILGMSLKEFKNRYCVFDLHGKKKGVVTSSANVKNLMSIIAPYVYDCALDLDKRKTYDTINYQIDRPKDYEDLKNEIINGWFDSDDPALFYSIATKLQIFYTATESRRRIIADLLADDEQKLIYVKYLANIPYGAPALTGDKTQTEWEKILSDFRTGEIRNLFVTYGTGSYGLNLQNCHRIVFADHCFDYAQRKQAEARIFRLGQEKDVRYTDLVCGCGLERMILQCLRKKSSLLMDVKSELEKTKPAELIKKL